MFKTHFNYITFIPYNITVQGIVAPVGETTTHLFHGNRTGEEFDKL